MKLGKQEIQLWLKEIDWIKPAKEILTDSKTYNFNTSFSVPIENMDDLYFDLQIHFLYPKTNLSFFLRNKDGYDHQMPQEYICLNPSIFFDAKTKFFHEFEKLKGWITKFYVNEERSEHYEHLMYPTFLSNSKMLFPEISVDYAKSKRFGYFNYIKINELKSKKGDLFEDYLFMKIDDVPTRYSSNYRETHGYLSSDIKQGIWFFINEQPIQYRRKPIVNWNDLLSKLDQTQIKHIYSYKEYLRKIRGQNYSFFILLGYPVTNTEREQEELHFQLIQDDLSIDPVQKKYFDLSKFKSITRDEPIKWGASQSISSKNYFGRGALSKYLIQSKILIIGVGAIGSSLSKILVRGGITNLSITDIDHIEPGNICRSEYLFNSVSESKVSALKRELSKINPFCNIYSDVKNYHMSQSKEVLFGIKKYLSHFDFIFDCTTDKYLSHFLDELGLKSKIINFSISNKAQHFVCVTGKGNIVSQKGNIYSKINDSVKQEPFYPETGCFHPTFEASYNDINLLLNYAIKEINLRIDRETGIESFVIETNPDSLKGFEMNINYGF